VQNWHNIKSAFISQSNRCLAQYRAKYLGISLGFDAETRLKCKLQ